MRIYGAQAGTYYFLNDHLGTPRIIINDAGQIVWQAAYLPFGKAQVLTETIVNNFRLPGQYHDSETGLHYNWNRYYDPEIGRYLRSDPIGLDGGINLYNYANSSPIIISDPKGLHVYRGYCRYISGGDVIGVGVIRCRVWTQCYNKRREEGELVAVFGGLTAGLPISVTYFNIAQYGRSLSSSPTLDELVGAASIYSLSSALGIGSSITELTLGNTTGEYNADSFQGGIDASVDAFIGFSYLESREKTCCYN